MHLDARAASLLSLPGNQLVEIALLTTCRVFLVQQGQTPFIELLEEIFPTDLFQFVIACVAGEIETQNASVSFVARTTYACRVGAPLLSPLLYRFVIYGDVGTCFGSATAAP